MSERFVEEEELLSRVEVTKDQQIQLFLETRAQGEGYVSKKTPLRVKVYF